MTWKEQLDELPLIYTCDMHLLMKYCIEGDFGGAYYVASREFTYEWGATYHFSISGRKSDRERLLDELNGELGDSLDSAKIGLVRHYWFKLYTKELPPHATYNMLGAAKIDAILKRHGITDEVEVDLLLDALARMDSLTFGDPLKAIPPAEVMLKLAQERREPIGKCLLDSGINLVELSADLEAAIRNIK